MPGSVELLGDRDMGRTCSAAVIKAPGDVSRERLS